jgi:hypothetical protein
MRSMVEGARPASPPPPPPNSAVAEFGFIPRPLHRLRRSPSPVSRGRIVLDVFSATAARMSAFNAFSPSWKSMARLVLPPTLALKR